MNFFLLINLFLERAYINNDHIDVQFSDMQTVLRLPRPAYSWEKILQYTAWLKIVTHFNNFLFMIFFIDKTWNNKTMYGFNIIMQYLLTEEVNSLINFPIMGTLDLGIYVITF